MAANHGASDASNFFRLAWKYSARVGRRSERSVAIALATASIVLGLYQRCGFGVESGRSRTFCATITLRDRFGEADSILFMNVSYPTPFCTMSCAALTSSATLGLDSNGWGSVLGVFRID